MDINDCNIGNYKVFYKNNNDGGGRTFGQDFIPEITSLYPGRVFDRCLEWCAGPGFIGYGLLSAGIINHVTMMDISSDALSDAEMTANYQLNGVRDKVTTIHAGCVAGLEGQFDLIVANPPHMREKTFGQINSRYPERIYLDPEWNIHREFYSNIKNNLAPEGVILLCEYLGGSSPESFRQMINDGGLQITNYFKARFRPPGRPLTWFIEVKHK
jgi:methylase of polypeptide subunit release factors